MLKKIISKLNIRHRLPLVSVLCLLAVYVSAQSYLSSSISKQFVMLEVERFDNQQNNKPAKVEPKLITVIKSKFITTTPRLGPDIKVLTGDVVFLHDGAYLYCDSAYYNEVKNVFEAFSNVRMEQGDTLFLYGNYMHYEGKTKLAKVRENVKMDHITSGSTLFTDSLNFDRIKNVGYYFDGGVLIDSLNELTSFLGRYQPNLKIATFTDSVKLINPNYILYTDTLKYSTDTRIATILSPSTILSDSGTIYSSRGWYNTLTDESLLLDQSRVINKEGDRVLTGDSIFYFKSKNYGEVFGNMFLQDTTKRVILKGHYGFYDGIRDYAYATDSASAIEYSQGDSLYLHANILELIKIQETDSVKKKPILANGIGGRVDTTEVKAQHEIKAYHGVRFYRSDVQGVCDSLQFNSIDSVLHMYQDPVLWNLDRQLMGDTIDIFMNDSTVDYMHVKRSAFAIEMKDSIHFNQLKSRSLKFFFSEGTLQRVLAEGNVETISYPEERDGVLSEILNWLESSFLDIELIDGVFERLKAWPSPVGKTTPFHLVQPEQRKLKDFYWYDYMRPLDKDDIFRKVERREGDIKPKRSAIFEREE